MFSLRDETLDLGHVRHLTAGFAAPDAISGTNGDDTLAGTDGNDLIQGLKGDDSIDGGAGRDVLRGGAGDDILNGGDQADKLSGGAGNDLLDGGSGGDRLDGGARDDTLIGGQSKDLLVGGDGNDLIYGDITVDTIDGGAGIDTMDYSTASRPVYLDLGGVDADGHPMVTGIDVIIGGAWVYNVITGNDEDNLISTGRNLDALDGAGGNDTLIGGDQADTLTGGAGADTFLYQDARQSTIYQPDTITDLSREDRIDLTALGVQFTVVDEFTSSGRGEITLHWDEASNVTTMLADGDGDGRADFELVLDGRHDHFTGFVF